MNQHAESNDLNVIDLGTHAMLELEELRQGLRSDAPSVHEFFDTLRSPAKGSTFAGNCSMSMLADIRTYTVLRTASGINAHQDYKQFEARLLDFLKQIEAGIDKHDRNAIEKAKSFCLILVNSFVAKGMSEVYTRRENSTSRYMTNALI